ncbi:efflux RND transporter periplasmic adaptor subunit [Arundinibacter roseus]|uniref:Efflux RND transporter periplasmic adaptor subunit n=1 Tax=Arundinibacter roseus TaxID=2070510 RepID=A0A4R4KG47_9BACT|nr:efflux RND transporter periplasmic adaptor subunit [Arundinibacter roseus]TDB65816.1 efflux RND transporter periplasmic adaptor subunit [Arundinibacter roseus]
MNQPFRSLFYIVLGLMLTTACQSPRVSEEDALAGADTTARELPLVEVATAQRRPFATQVISNGRVVVPQQAELSFRSPGTIERVYVQNGASVAAGQLLASLYNADAQLALQKAELQLAESRVEINDLLITQGGRRGDTSSVSAEIYRFIRLRSGYDRALLAVREARLLLENTYLRAPMPGVVANLTLSAHNPTPVGKPFCILLNRTELRVVCPLLESELATVQAGQTARIETLGAGGGSYAAQVVTLNPLVSSEGLVEATLRLQKPDARLLSGMNVRVVIEKSLPNQLVVPKAAVVERNGRKVVFSFADGLAKWNYVTTGPENSTDLCILEGLEPGQQLIVSGNLNLGHDAKVEVRKADAADAP